MTATQELVFDQAESQVPDQPRALATAPADALNPLMLLQQAVERGMDPGQLKALVDLQEQWRAARAKEAFAAAMNAVQAELPCIVRDAHNEQTKSSYVRFETITHLAKPIYTRHGFSLSFSEDSSDKPAMGNGQPWKRIVCLVRHNEGHSERHWIDLPCDGIGPKGNAIGGMNAVQGAVSSGSYGQRVLTCRIFNITIADTDLDGNAPNPPADPNAPTARPRGKRDEPPAVTKEQCGALLIYWRAKNPEPSGDTKVWNERFYAWAEQTVGHQFDAKKSTEWTADDFHACCRSLNYDPEAK